MPLSRRDFLKVFGVAAGAAVVAPHMPPIPAGAPVVAAPNVADVVDDALDAVDLPDAMPYLSGDKIRAIHRQQVARIRGSRTTIYINGQQLERVIRFELVMSTPVSEYIGGWGGYYGGLKGAPQATLHIEAFGQGTPIPLGMMQPVNIEICQKEAYSTILQAFPISIGVECGVGQLAVYRLDFAGIGDVRMVETKL